MISKPMTGGAVIKFLRRGVAATCSLLLLTGIASVRASESDPSLVGDGVTMNTTAFNTRIAELSRAGGGTLKVPPGRYLTGTIYLQNNVTLHLEQGAVILGSTNLADYPVNPPPLPDQGRLEFGRYSLIYAAGQTNLSITGSGEIYGQGDSPFFTKKFLLASGWTPSDAYLKRPYGLCFVGCRQVRVQDVTLNNIAFWVQDYLNCEDVVVRGVTVDSFKSDYNNDGIDVDGSRNVTIVDCHFTAGDDAICLKSSYSLCENVTISNCVLRSMANGIKFGTASRRGFKNISVDHCVINDTCAAGLALEIVDGGILDGVTVRDVKMNKVGAAIFIHLGDRAKSWVVEPQRPPVGIVRNVSISNVTATIANFGRGGDYASSISGLPGHPVENVALSDIQITNLVAPPKSYHEIPSAEVPENLKGYPEFWMFGPLPASGIFFRHATGLVLNRVDIQPQKSDPRPALAFYDVQDVTVDGVPVSASIIRSTSGDGRNGK
jgi:polygalacturonase